jgi:hypothetical protein
MNYSELIAKSDLERENAKLRSVMHDLLIRQGMATPAWEPARAVLGLPPAIPKRGR